MLSKSGCVFAVLDAFIVGLISAYASFMIVNSMVMLGLVAFSFIIVTFAVLALKGFYEKRKYTFKDLFTFLEAIFIASFISAIPLIMVSGLYGIQIAIFVIVHLYILLAATRIIYLIAKKFFRRTKNILIVGAGQDGKLIAEEIQSRPDLGMKVVGFLDDNMNNIEEEDSSIPILGLTYDCDSVIKDNNVDMVIVAVKSRMDSDILTDLAKGIPMGVEVWRMPTFYAHITKKEFTSKMAVNWLFYDYVRSKHIIYSRIKRVLDIIFALIILILTLPLTLIAILDIKLSDFGPVFFTQTRTGKFEKPFRMVKFRTMYQDKVDEDFDDDLEDIEKNDKRIIPFCRWIRKFHIDDIPQMFNVLKGEMSLIGPRPVREDVYFKNKNNIPFWECRSWVRPGCTGWQQVNAEDCIPEERLGYDLYYIKHRTLHWEFAIFIQYVIKLLTGKCK